MSQFPADIEKSIAVYHYDNSTKRYPASTDATISGAMLPLDRKDHAFEGGEYVDPHELYLDPSTTIRVSDKLVISGSTYYVKQIFTANFGGMPHKRVTISVEV